MSAFVFGPHIITNTIVPGRPFSANFRASVKKNGVHRDNLGRILRDSAGRLRLDIEFQGTHVGYRILDPVAGVQTLVDDIHKTYVESTCGTGPQSGMPDPSSEKRMINGVECLRFPPAPTLEEAWVSPELELVIHEHVRDESTESTWDLYDIVRAEPDESLFRIPPDYQAATRPDA
jgi:hypothetical protein